MIKYKKLVTGDIAPLFQQQSTSNPNYHFDTVAGRYIVLCFHMSASDSGGKNMLHFADANRALFDDNKICFFGVSIDPNDVNHMKESLPGIRHFFDFDGKISQLYGAIPLNLSELNNKNNIPVRRFWLIINPNLHIRYILQAQPDGSELSTLRAYLTNLPETGMFSEIEIPAPIIIIPNVFENALCDQLIALYEKKGGVNSGFMRDVDGKTAGIYDNSYKTRNDCTLDDETLIKTINHKISRRVLPEIKKAFHFDVTRLERNLIACYDACNGGHFHPHRDDTSKGTAHRKFALSIALNADFTGGELYFPEYSQKRIKVPKGSAVVFSGSILHAVASVTSGKRYVFLPFLYDEASAKLREINNSHLEDAQKNYSM